MNLADDLVDVMDVMLVVSRVEMMVSWVWMTVDELAVHSVGKKDAVMVALLAVKRVDK